MTTSNVSTTPVTDSPVRPAHGPVRLRLALHPGNQLDGGWWPRSRDLPTELAELVDHFPPEHGRVVRALYSPPDWEPAPRRVPVIGGWVKVGAFPHDDTHLILLKTSDRRLLRILVVPPGFSADQGAEALLAAASRGNTHSARALLRTVTEHPDVDPQDHWRDDGGSWWGSKGAPSFRTDA